ncbi:alanine--tRNA ligase, partial [Patescibacteria group bacterium]|nr:alanine--tRNA ligase [Patescibacteria group bacterium]
DKLIRSTIEPCRQAMKDAGLSTSDIDEVGDESHLTFFEMLGNFSFNDYFKEEAICWAIEFLKEKCGIDEEKLWFTFFKGENDLLEDKESKDIFLRLGISEEKIFGFGKQENFWGPTGNEGPCGPTAEIHYDLTGKSCSLGKGCKPNCKCNRFIELWNLVFNEFYQNKKEELSHLKQKGIDTGLGLERLVAVMQNKSSVFETDLFESLGNSRILADHIRAIVFLAAEGIVPEKIGRGYILRRLLRKAIRENGEIIDLAKKVIEMYKDIYSELKAKETDILNIIQKEIQSFGKALEAGKKEYNKIKGDITGALVFELYSTHSIPLETTIAWAKEDKKEIKNIEDFYKLTKEHQEISRAGAEKKFGGLGKEAKSEEAIKLHTATHLLHSALRQILGNNVQQMGSDINSERLRFDFSFDRKLTVQEIKQIEDLVNQKIKQNLDVKCEQIKLEEAIKSGALSFFKEKYPDKVSVYSINDFSKEICAGPHSKTTGHLGDFKILKEKSSSAGIRRIKAILK